MQKLKRSKKLPNNLVALVYASNSCYTIVTDRYVPGLVVNITPGQPALWYYKHPNDRTTFAPRSKKIGEYEYSMKNCTSGVIGIYDRMNIEHLESMVRHSQEMTDNESDIFCD